MRQQRNRAPQRPATTPVPVKPMPAAPAPAQPSASQSRLAPSSLPTAWKITMAAVVVLALLGFLAISLLGIGSPVDRSKYQAVFLTNGQVYFGKLSGWGSAQPVLRDVYYFQANNDAAPEEGEAPQAGNNAQTLIKLGEEIHKPTDKLILNRDAILFVENIEDDGQVVEAIKKNQENN